MAANLPDKNSPEGKAAREQLSQMLSNLAQQMKDAGLPMDNLEDALKALKEGNIDQFVKNMEVAGEDLKKLSEMAKQLQALQQQQAADKMVGLGFFGLGNVAERGEKPDNKLAMELYEKATKLPGGHRAFANWGRLLESESPSTGQSL